MNNKHGKYYYGKPQVGQFDHVIDAFVAHESVHSVKTSSLPLVQFWHDKSVMRNVEQIKGADGLTGEELRKIQNIFLEKDSLRCFEYATCVQGGRGKASMTDLMLLAKGSNRNYKIAIEAKFTEYQEDPQYRPTVKMWKSEKNSKKDDGQNREKVLEGWCNYITGNGGELDFSNIDEIPYQLVHRIASACAKDEDDNAHIPIVLYHLFYEKDDKEKVNQFQKNIEGWVEKLDLKGIGFYVLTTMIKIRDSVFAAKEDDEHLNNLFKETQHGGYCEVIQSALYRICAIPQENGE